MTLTDALIYLAGGITALVCAVLYVKKLFKPPGRGGNMKGGKQ